MKTPQFIPRYSDWKQECKSGARAVLVSETRHTTNQIFDALCRLKTKLYGSAAILPTKLD